MNELTEIEKVSRQVMNFISKNSPTILTGFAVAGLVTTIGLSIKDTIKALEVLEREKEFRKVEEGDTSPMEPIDVVELTWKCYIPTIASGLLTVSCMIGSNHISLRRNAALVSLYSIAETTLKEYQEKVVEQIGEKKAEKIKDEIAQEHLDKNPVTNKTIILTGKGENLFYDTFSGRYFKSDVETIRRIVNDFNFKLLQCAPMFMSINELYYELGLEAIELGDEMGWNAEDNKLEVRFTSKMTKDGVPCGVLEYAIWPKHY